MPYNLSTMQSIFCNNKEITEIRYNGSLVYKKQSGPDYSEPFYVENITNENETLSIVRASIGTAPSITIEYKTDNTDWDTLGTTSTTPLTLPLAPGEKVYLKCNTNTWGGTEIRYNTISGVSKVGGNIMSLLYGDNFADKTSFPAGDGYTFNNIFYNNSRLQDASELLLPVTTLVMGCYSGMFSYCTSLTTAPVLPATTLANYCYSGIFRKCTSLTTAPVLPATTLRDSCYNNMFGDCTALSNVKCLATSGFDALYPTNTWLSGVSSTGTFTKAAGVTWPTGDNGIPSGWTVVEV